MGKERTGREHAVEERMIKESAGKLRLSLACGPYDRMDALFKGDIGINGVELEPHVIAEPMEIFSRMLAEDAFDVAEMSLTHCFMLGGSSHGRFVTIPVFPSRMFRHGFIFVNRRSGIACAQDLAGKRIGLQGFQMTAAVWIRGLLRQDYGVDLGTVEWLVGGVNQRGVAGASATRLRPARPIDIRSITGERNLSDLLAAGEIDALIGAHVPASLRSHDDVVRLFPDYHAVERDYFRRTGIFPIMHALVIREELHRAHPWLARRIYHACEAAKSAALERLRFPAALRVTLPWMLEQVEELDDVFGDDPWPYGLDPNRRTLEAFARYLVEDGFMDRTLALEDAFVPTAE